MSFSKSFTTASPRATPGPKILGLTANPIFSLKDPLGSLGTLAPNTQGKTVAVRANDSELQTHANKPVEEIVWYLSDLYVESTELFKAASALDLDKVGKVKWDSVEQKATLVLGVLGPQALDDFIIDQLAPPVEAEIQGAELLGVRRPAAHAYELEALSTV